ncbi:MAG: TM0106 family RecB-like putative nuclease [Calothrix sp. MO_192.B10]|nr:TM0106 family RecB-like putative nuclease [Calothrix sp. MO_192.B10]
MLINAEQLLQYQRCKRRPFLDVRGEKRWRDSGNDLIKKLHQDKTAHQKRILGQFTYERPQYPPRDWHLGHKATLELMRSGVDCIHKGVLLVNYGSEYTLVSHPHLLIKQQGKSLFGDWYYAPANIELGKRPKQEYQVVVAFHAQVLARLQQSELDRAWLMLRGKDGGYPVDLSKWIPQMESILEEFIHSLKQDEAPEMFISRQRCSICHWHSDCYAIAKSNQHLSLLPGVTPVRYTQLQELNITTPESLASTHPSVLSNLVGFDERVASKLVLQAQSVLENRPLLLPFNPEIQDMEFQHSIELYFDIEAQPDLKLNYLLGVLVVDKQNHTEKFYSFLAEKPEDEQLVWQQFLDLVWQYPQAPIYHFCVYEFDTVKRLGKLYRTPQKSVLPVLNRFVDIYEHLIQNVALPVESYALKAIARWLGFEWRNPEASGAKCIYWYDQWLKTGDRNLLEIIQLYNEDDCRATRSVKDWLFQFYQEQSQSHYQLDLHL